MPPPSQSRYQQQTSSPAQATDTDEDTSMASPLSPTETLPAREAFDDDRLSPLEKEVLREYQKLKNNLDVVCDTFTSTAFMFLHTKTPCLAISLFVCLLPPFLSPCIFLFLCPSHSCHTTLHPTSAQFNEQNPHTPHSPTANLINQAINNTLPAFRPTLLSNLRRPPSSRAQNGIS